MGAFMMLTRLVAVPFWLFTGAGLLALPYFPSVAYAEEEEEDWLESDDEDAEEKSDEDAPKRMEGNDDLDLDDDEDELDAFEFEDTKDSDDLLEDDSDTVEIGGPGQDNAGVYRQQQDIVKDLSTDEEVIAWESYLETYHNTLFREQIEGRVEALMEQMHAVRIDRTSIGTDAGNREIEFAQALLLESLNPRTRFQSGFEWGLPDYINIMVDYEHQLRRDLSVHAGIKHRYTGWSLESGVRWAFIKSSRTKTIVALIGDLHINTDPAFLGLRPQLGLGKQWGPIDVQMQIGPDLELRSIMGLRLIGGANVTYRAAENVAVFGETNINMKNLAWDQGGSFRFNVMSFGLKFYPGSGGAGSGDMEVNLGASVPYTTNYWMYHFGSIMVQVNYYM